MFAERWMSISFPMNGQNSPFQSIYFNWNGEMSPFVENDTHKHYNVEFYPFIRIDTTNAIISDKWINSLFVWIYFHTNGEYFPFVEIHGKTTKSRHDLQNEQRITFILVQY